MFFGKVYVGLHLKNSTRSHLPPALNLKVKPTHRLLGDPRRTRFFWCVQGNGFQNFSFGSCVSPTPNRDRDLSHSSAALTPVRTYSPCSVGQGITVAVGTTIADRPRTDPYKRLYAYGSYAR